MSYRRYGDLDQKHAQPVPATVEPAPAATTIKAQGQTLQQLQGNNGNPNSPQPGARGKPQADVKKGQNWQEPKTGGGGAPRVSSHNASRDNKATGFNSAFHGGSTISGFSNYS